MSRALIAAATLALCLTAGAALEQQTSSKTRHKSGRHGSMLRRNRKDAAGSFIHSMGFKHSLRVCNAYPYDGAMDVYRGKEKLTGSPMPYKMCQEFAPNLQSGDRLDFKVGELSAGAFSVSDLPENDAVLMLVIFRHDTLSTAVSFESHVFANLMNSQIAVLNTYRGRAEARLKIQDVADSKTERVEELRYDSVVAVNPGKYEVVMESEDDKMKAKAGLVALNRESYVVVRCGVDAEKGKSFPEEIIVFPKSDPAMLGAAAGRLQPLALSVLMAVLAAVFAMASAE